MATVRSKNKIARALKKKGFEATVDKDHVFFFFLDPSGKRTAVRTMVSHGAKTQDIGGALLGQMARQCRLTKQQFLELVDCDLSESQYREKLQDGGHIAA